MSQASVRVTRSSDGQMLFLDDKPSEMKRGLGAKTLQEKGGIEGFLQREVLPYAEDAWYVPKSVKIGYEISFNRYFYKPAPMRTLEGIRADSGGDEGRERSVGCNTRMVVRNYENE